MIPTIGRIVHYTLSHQDAQQINRRRTDASDKMVWHRAIKSGAMVHVGNPVSEGDVYPLVITRVWGKTEETAVNGQVLLDGTDTLWVSSVRQGNGERQWREPVRVQPA